MFCLIWSKYGNRSICQLWVVWKCYCKECNVVSLFSVLLSILKMFPKVSGCTYVCVCNISDKLWGKMPFLKMKHWGSPYGAHIITKVRRGESALQNSWQQNADNNLFQNFNLVCFHSLQALDFRFFIIVDKKSRMWKTRHFKSIEMKYKIFISKYIPISQCLLTENSTFKPVDKEKLSLSLQVIKYRVWQKKGLGECGW